MHGPIPIDLMNFSFELHTSFPNEDEAMGLELFDVLTELCEKYNMKQLFVHHSRITKRSQDTKSSAPQVKRMDQASYKAAFVEYEKPESNVVKVWVCGPPVM